jgi:large subunit ribosomal protein L21
MYAVIQTGGKQYRVAPGDIVQIEKIEGEVGSNVKFNEVLFCSKQGAENSQIWLGKPTLAGAAVEGEVVGQGRGEKLLLVKMKRRKQYRRTQGHRQYLTQVLVTGVSNGSGESATLSADDKKKKLSTFQSHLAPKGLAHTPKTLGSRKRLAAAGGKAAAPAADAPKAEAAKKAPAKKAPAKKKAE